MSEDVVPDPSGKQIRTVYLDKYDEMEAELIVEILRDSGMFAMTKNQMTEGSHDPYLWHQDVGIVLVDSSRVDEARELIRTQLPAHLETIKREMDLLEQEGQSPQPEE